MTSERDVQFLTSTFKKYYYDHIFGIPEPEHILNREFGYQKFDTPGMIRHIQIKDVAQMRVMLLRNAPSDVYCSNACYMFPNLEMSQKDWQGADLIFDVDAKDLELPCRQDHVIYACTECNRACTYDGAKDDSSTGREPLPAPCCSICNNTTSVKPKSLPCKKCMDASKLQIRSLVKILRDDLGVPDDAISTYFSGNEGFHVHVTCDAFFGLDSRARTELVDYITLRGLVPETLGMRKKGPDKEGFVDMGEHGWRGRFAKSLFGTRLNRTAVISEFAKYPEKGYYKFQDMIKAAISKVGTKIDPSVTMDVHRVFRMPYTLNSKSGMLKAPCYNNIDSFNPYEDAVALSGYDDAVSVTIDCPVKFRICGKRYGPYHNERADVPVYVAAYVLCKGLGTIP